jgi:hypothetical protein
MLSDSMNKMNAQDPNVEEYALLYKNVRRTGLLLWMKMKPQVVNKPGCWFSTLIPAPGIRSEVARSPQ